MPELTTPADRRTAETRTLLACGVVAGPLFLAGSLVQAFTREGYDLGRHPISLLSLGDLGWLQVTNFVVTGALYGACAVGLRRALRPGSGGTWGPPRRCTWGRPRLRRPVRHRCRSRLSAGSTRWGTRPDQLARAAARGRLHGRRFQHDRRLPRIRAAFRGAQAAGLDRGVLATPVVVLGLSFWPDLNGLSVRLVIATAILFGFVAAAAARARERFRRPRSSACPSPSAIRTRSEN